MISFGGWMFICSCRCIACYCMISLCSAFILLYLFFIRKIWPSHSPYSNWPFFFVLNALSICHNMNFVMHIAEFWRQPIFRGRNVPTNSYTDLACLWIHRCALVHFDAEKIRLGHKWTLCSGNKYHQIATNTILILNGNIEILAIKTFETNTNHRENKVSKAIITASAITFLIAFRTWAWNKQIIWFISSPLMNTCSTSIYCICGFKVRTLIRKCPVN